MAIAEAPDLCRAPRDALAAPRRGTLARRIGRHWADYLYIAAGDPDHARRHRLPARLHRLAVLSRHPAAHRRLGLQWRAELSAKS